MKKLIFILAACGLLLTACKGDEPKQKLLDPNAMILIKEAKVSKPQGIKPLYQAPNEQQLPTWEWVVKNAVGMLFYNKEYQSNYMTRGIADGQRDFENLAIKMFGSDIIAVSGPDKGKLQTIFLGAEDCIFLYRNDTVAYIPNDTLRNARIKVEAAYNAGNYDEVYSLFNKAYTAQPTTGKIWRELKAQGKN